MLIGLPATVAPVTWSCGFSPWALPFPSLIRAYLAPENDSASNVANGPPQVVRTPILIAPAGADAGAAAVCEPPPPDDALLPELLPHATSASAATAATAAAAPWAPRRLLAFLIEPPAP